ncbi:hypothetical protein Sjap_018118 [Stephania japonica]|uniref:Kinetochore protein NDC80 n=1 Tax=Stephania japonica TaxID=461633 RepID=A0AAP0I7L0_9MAGN
MRVSAAAADPPSPAATPTRPPHSPREGHHRRPPPALQPPRLARRLPLLPEARRRPPPLLLSSLSCPVKFQKSVLKAPGTPHSWPTLLAVIHWLVQLALYNDHVSDSANSFLQSDGIMAYSLQTYSRFITGDDAGEAALQEEFEGKLAEQMEEARGKVEGLEREAAELRGAIERMRTEPSAREVLEKEKGVLENDLPKFHSLIEEFERGIEVMEKGLAEKEGELEAKERDNRRTCEENEELRRKADAQTVNLRDAERMKRELMALERDISEAEIGRNAWEEKAWDVDTSLAHKFKELQTLSIECNQAIRRLKLGNEFQHTLNSKGATPAEVLGVDYKLTLKPLLSSFLDDVKKSSEKQLKELISLRQHSRENAAKLDEKRNSLSKLQAQIDMVESQLSLMKKELEDFMCRCDSEAKVMVEDFERERGQLEMLEREAEEHMQISRSRLREVVKQSNEEIQKVESELLSLIDYISKYKEFMESKISEIKRNLSDTAGTVANAYKGSLAAEHKVQKFKEPFELRLSKEGRVGDREKEKGSRRKNTDEEECDGKLVLKRVRKESANKGRLFYNYSSSHYPIFLWIDKKEHANNNE